MGSGKSTLVEFLSKMIFDGTLNLIFEADYLSDDDKIAILGSNLQRLLKL